VPGGAAAAPGGGAARAGLELVGPVARATGFDVLAERDFVIDLRAVGQAAIRYARLWLSRLARTVADELADDDRRLLAELMAAEPGRPGLHLRGVRTVTLARPA